VEVSYEVTTTGLILRILDDVITGMRERPIID
jgi:hypothetical protein